MALVTINQQGSSYTYATAGESGFPAGNAASGSGLSGAVIQVPLTEMRTNTGAVLSASSGSGFFGISNTTGTSLALTSAAANSTTVTSTALYELVMPYNFSGGNFNITVNAAITIGAGTLTTKTVAAHCYLLANAGTSGADLVTTTAITFTANTAADYVFSVTGATVTGGARLIITVVTVITETAGSNVTNTVNSVRLS